MKIVKKIDIPGYLTCDILSTVWDDLNDNCQGTIGCLYDDGCDAGGKHFSRNEKITIVCTGIFWVPLVLAADAINTVIFPIKVGARVGEKCCEI